MILASPVSGPAQFCFLLKFLFCVYGSWVEQLCNSVYEETTMSRISPVKRASVANPGYPHINKLSIGAVTLALSPKAPPGEIANSEVFSKRLS